MRLVKKPGDGRGAITTPPAPAASNIASAEPFRIDPVRHFADIWKAMTRDAPWATMSGLTPWPAADLTEDETAITIRIDVPGMRAEEIEVELLDAVLWVRGSREKEERSEKPGYRHYERYHGAFERTFPLPSYADAAHVEAKCENGILSITVPKLAGKRPSKVPVTGGGKAGAEAGAKE